MAGLYIHIPFCLSKCPYCDFYSVKYDSKTADRYKTAVINNLLYYGGKFDTVYFGGGTPILLWKEICEMLEEADCTENAEITVEANPCCTDREKLSSLKKSGVNRISFGIQSLDDGELKRLGRRHSAEAAVKAVELAFDCGFENISADIMLGTEGQTVESVHNTVAVLSRLPVTHISAYMLKIEENTPFAKADLDLPDEERVCEIYLKAVRFLEEEGFKQYEISNFAKDGFPCRHNLKYWNCKEYLGIGPAAHSYCKGKRFFVKRDLDDFLAADIQKTEVEEESPVDNDEYAMLRLRLTEGLDLNEYKKRGGDVRMAVEAVKMLPDNLVLHTENKISLTAEGFLISNAVIGKILGY